MQYQTWWQVQIQGPNGKWFLEKEYLEQSDADDRRRSILANRPNLMVKVVGIEKEDSNIPHNSQH
jgi:hypothetical protein